MFEVATRRAGESCVIDLAGEFGRDGGEAIINAVQENWSPPLRLVLNFSGVSTINSAGLGGVIWSVRYVTRAGGESRAYGLSEHLRRILYVMGLVAYLQICPDEAGALE